jgi:hypothetical protein
MGRRIAVAALWLAVVATALAVPAPPKEDHHDQATVQQKGECVGALLATLCLPRFVLHQVPD